MEPVSEVLRAPHGWQQDEPLFPDTEKSPLPQLKELGHVMYSAENGSRDWIDTLGRVHQGKVKTLAFWAQQAAHGRRMRYCVAVGFVLFAIVLACARS